MCSINCSELINKGHFTHESRVVTVTLWRPKGKCPKPIRIHLQNDVVRSQTLSSVMWRHMWLGTQPNVILVNVYSSGFLHMISRMNQRLWAFGIPWSPGFVLGLLPRGGSWKLSKWPWNMVHSMPCRNPFMHYIHLAFTYSVSPSSVVGSELGRASSFPPMRLLEV
jgi:hypothetical protein